MQQITQNLSSLFGLEKFRTGQKEIIQSIVKKKDVLAIMPTGGGKSLCYQLPAYSKPGLTLVISPLIALMNDQVRHLKKLNLPVGCIHSNMDVEVHKNIFANMKTVLKNGGSYTLFITPERVQKPGFPEWIKQQPVNYFAIDEAHCVSKWGHDFRQEYSKLSVLKDLMPDVPIIALTLSLIHI